MLKSFISPDEWKHDFFNLVCWKKNPQSPIILTCQITPTKTIWCNCKIFNTWLFYSIDQIHRNSTESKSTGKDEISVFNTMNSLTWCFAYLSKIVNRLFKNFSKHLFKVIKKNYFIGFIVKTNVIQTKILCKKSLVTVFYLLYWNERFSFEIIKKKWICLRYFFF